MMRGRGFQDRCLQQEVQFSQRVLTNEADLRLRPRVGVGIKLHKGVIGYFVVEDPDLARAACGESVRSNNQEGQSRSVADVDDIAARVPDLNKVEVEDDI
jgi:hypothetical protein